MSIDLGDDWDLEIRAIHAEHDEVISNDYAVGVVLEVKGDEPAESWFVGLTSDTGYYEGLETSFQRCDPVILHLGDCYPDELVSYAATNGEKNFRLTKTDRYVKTQAESVNSLETKRYHEVGGHIVHQRHLGLAGVVTLIEKLALEGGRDIILSEYPEEMGSYRRIVARAISEAINEGKEEKDKIRLISGDIGLSVAHKEGAPVYRCEICALDNDLRSLEGGHLNKYHLSSKLTSICIQREDERIAYRCEAHKVKPKNLWAHSSLFISRCMISAPLPKLKPEWSEETKAKPGSKP
jgi:hypothetical protein